MQMKIEAMTRKLIILGSVVALILVAGATIAGTTLAQKGQFSHIFVQNDGDTDVVAVVQGKTVTRGDIRKPAEFHRTVDPSLTEDESVKMVIVFVVDDRVLQAEVERRNLVPTDAETEAYMKPTKNACLEPKPQSTERARVRGLLKKQKGAPLNLG